MTLGEVADVGWLLVARLSIQFTLLVALGAFLHWLLRRQDPRVRHALWLLILLRIFVPIYPTTPIGLGPEVGGSWWAVGGSAGIRPSEGLLETGVSVGRDGPSKMDGVARSEKVGDEAASQTSSNESMPPQQSRPAAGLRARYWPMLRRMSLFVWLVGVAMGGGLSLLRVRRTQSLLSNARPNSQLTALAQPLGERLGLRRAVPVLVPEPEDGPMVLAGPILLGVLTPQILVPRSVATQWAVPELEAGLLHELAHVKRGDLWVCLLQGVARVAFFFHPLVWWVNRNISFERELCCDDTVLSLSNGPRKPYLQALLRCVRRVNAGQHAGALGIAGGNTTVSRRIRRMASSQYSVRQSRPIRAMLTILVAVLFSVVLLGNRSVGRESDEGNAIEAPRVHGIRTMGVYFAADGNGVVNWSDPLAWSGDVSRVTEIPGGRRFSSVKIPNDVDGTVRLRTLVGIDGTVHSAEVLQGIDPDVDQAFLDIVRNKRFEQTLHKAHGPVAVELVFVMTVEPPSVPIALREDLGEVVELVRVLDFAGTAEERKRVEDALPEFLVIQSMEPFQGVNSGEIEHQFDGDYSFSFSIDEEGEVGRVARHALPGSLTRLGGLSEQVESLMDEFTVWLETFRFEPLADAAAGPLKVLVTADLRVSGGEVRVATYTPPTDDWRTQLATLYSLEEGQNVKLIPAPFLPARLDLFRALDPSAGRRHPDGSSNMTLFWNDRGLIERIPGNCYGGCRLFSGQELHENGVFLSNLALEHGVRFEIDVADDVGDAFLGAGDILLREGTSVPELLDGFVAELHRLLQEPVRWERSVRSDEVLVLRGRLGSITSDPAFEGKPVLHLFTDKRDETPHSGPGFWNATDGASVARALETFLHTPVVDETVGPAQEPFTVKLHRSAQDTEFLNLVASNIEEQSDLEVTIEQRPIDVVRIVVGE